MEFNEYQKQASRTLPSLGEKLDLCHMIMGICSEFPEKVIAEEEKDDINKEEEIADQFWYIANYCTLRGYTLSELWMERLRSEKLDYESEYYCVGVLQDMVKKYIAYNKPIDCEKEKLFLRKLLLNLEEDWELYNFTISQLMETLDRNIQKLKARYPDSFSEERALNRDLKTERKILSGNGDQ